MPQLHTSRFRDHPYFFKIFTLLGTSVTLVALIMTPANGPPGSSLMWMNVTFALTYDVATIVLLLLDLDQQFFPFGIISYAAFEAFSSLLCSIFYFMSIWLSVSSNELEPSFWYTALAFLCAFDCLLFFWNFFNYIRIYVSEQRHTQAELAASTYDNPNYGAP